MKANVDVYDSLHSCRVAGTLVWNGVNEILRRDHPGIRFRLRHEVSTGFRAMIDATGVVPEEVACRARLLGAYAPASQFGDAIFETTADAIVLSVQPELQVPLQRHRQAGYLFHAADADLWPADDRAWLDRCFEPPDPPDVARSMEAFEGVLQRIRRRTEAPILVYNMSSVIPGERIHCFQGLDDCLSTQIRRFNLSLVELSERLGISIIDVDAVLARSGADRLKVDVLHLTPEGYRLVAEEVVRVLADLALLPPEGSA
jgi:hypothetical protein